MEVQYNVLVPEKSPNDKRDYQALTLKNGTKVVLIHDPTLEKSACSISVGVGSLQDPESSLGLAHFLQHMLFMGSTKFPIHNEYSSFISLNSGMDNAYTSDEETNYYFEIANKAFPEAMERLCNFFTGALLTESCVNKQRQAVHEQYILWTNDDNCRKWEVVRKLGLHPYAKFTIGNNETLGHEKVRTDLVDFYNKNYSSNITNAVLCSSMPLQQMKENIMKHLEAMPNKNHPGFKYDIPFPKDKLGKFVRMQSIKDETILEIFWVIEHLRHKYKQHVGDYLTHVLGHQGKNSLLAYLKTKKYASSISSYQHQLMSQTIIGLDIKLTEKGQECYQQVYNIVMDYVSSLKAEKFIYDEIRERYRIEFQFKEKSENYHYVCGLSSKMHYIPLPEILNYKSLFDEFKPEIINNVLAQLNPFNLIAVLSNSKEIEGAITEKYLGANYKVESLPQRKNIDHKFVSLCQNTFIPISTEVLKPMGQDQIPKKIKDNAYFLQDSEFKVCKGGVRLIAYGPEKSGFLELYAAYLELLLTSITYDAQSFNTRVSYEEKQKLVMQVSGFSDTIIKLIKKIGKHLLASHSDSQAQILFEIAQQNHLQELNNFYCGDVDQIAEDTRNIIMKQGRPTIEQQTEEAQAFQFKSFSERAINFWKQSTFEWVIVGNFSESDSLDMINTFETSLERKEAAPIRPVGCIKLNEKQLKHQILLDEEEIKTSCCVVYYEAGQYSNKLYYALQILKNHISQPFFNELRTERQLAYYLSSRIVNTKGILGMHFLLVSSTIDAELISQEIKKFVVNFFQNLKTNFPPQKIAQVKESVRVKTIAPHNNLNKLFEFVCSEVNNRTYYFNRKSKEQVSKQLDLITFDDLLTTANAFLQHSLCVMVTSKLHQEEYNKHRPACLKIEEIKSTAKYHEDNMSKLDFAYKG